MKVLLVGSGAREHAIAKALSRSPQEPRIFAYMSTPNPGIIRLAEGWIEGGLNDLPSLVRYAQRVRPNLVVFGPEEPLAAGAVDELEERGFSCIGPRRILARLEADKCFMREFMARYIGRGFPKWWVFENLGTLHAHLLSHPNSVLKPVGLTGGKGVRVLGRQLTNVMEAIEYARPYLEREGKILVEEKLTGEEFSLMVFTDGKKVVPMPLVQDYKYAREGDTGPMTGGMGSYSCADYLLPFVSQKDFETALGIVEETVKKLEEALGIPYRGVLYGQFIQTQSGPVVIEFNVRFGDPEAINVLSLLESDAVDVFASIAAGDLVEDVRFSHLATVCRYLVPRGYPDAPETGVLFSLPLEKLSLAGIEVYFGSVQEVNGQFSTTASRSVALLSRRATPQEAKHALDEALADYTVPLYWRRDIPRLL
ncbi:MAG: phosphoribosylamine--glycine ligase [Candidatus Hadarchaeum sp.]|uniref:phosphoribosylamine--glycine ligase n=1 Tax=Candidatus Hadarchaeum sp. TaxID=2883567 RepID=UPI003D0BF9DB